MLLAMEQMSPLLADLAAGEAQSACHNREPFYHLTERRLRTFEVLRHGWLPPAHHPYLSCTVCRFSPYDGERRVFDQGKRILHTQPFHAVLEALHRQLCDESSAVHHADPIADPLQFVHEMAGDEHRGVLL